nr:tetratricopeptide repeat protein [Deltaproteobacteria bacterium]
CTRAVELLEGQSPRPQASLLRARRSLGLALVSAGELDRAGQLIDETLVQGRALFGDAHPDNLGLMELLATIRARRGRMGEAVTMGFAAVAGFESVVGPTNIRTANARLNLGVLLLEAGRPVEAEAMLGEAVVRFQEGGVGGRSLAMAQHDHALTLVTLGQLDRARDAEAAAIVTLESAEGPDARGLGHLHGGLGRVEVAAGRRAAALRAYARARTLFTQHDDTAGMQQINEELAQMNAADSPSPSD